MRDIGAFFYYVKKYHKDNIDKTVVNYQNNLSSLVINNLSIAKNKAISSINFS